MSTPMNSEKQANRTQSKSDVVWVGECTMEDGKQHYEQCIIRGISVNLNDFVMINTGDVFSIGRVLDLHDLGPYPDRYRAKIHWLYKHEDLIRLIPDCTLEKRPNELFIPAFDPERKPFKGSVEVIDAETIDDVCTVKFLNEKQGFPRPPGTAKDTFYVKFAFDENYKVYSAGTYIEKLEEALRDSEASIQKNKCRTPRLFSSGRKWRIGTPKAANHSNSPFSLKPLKITLKACNGGNIKQKIPSRTTKNEAESKDSICNDSDEFSKSNSAKRPAKRQASKSVTYVDETVISTSVEKRKKSTKNKTSSASSVKKSAKKPSKRKASKSIPDEGEVASKKSRVKSSKNNYNTPEIQRTPKMVLSPYNTSYSADQVREHILSTEDDEECSGYGSEDGEVFFTEKTPVIHVTPPRKRETRSQSKGTKDSKQQRNKENKKSVSKQPPKPQYQTPKITSRSKSTTGKPSVQSVKSSRKVSVKTPSRKQSTKVVDDVLAGDVTPKKTPGRVGRKSLAEGLTPSMPCRAQPCKTPRTPLQEARSRLHVSAVPPSLPCREDEFADILGFVEGKLIDETGGCMYISGVPGTGKTATVHEVIRVLQDSEDEDIPEFTFIEINGMKLTEPNQAYSMLLKKMTGQKATPAHASDLLEKMFSTKSKAKESLVLMVDELDLLWTRKQGVMYNLFEWPSRSHSKLIVLAIANTMDLPERMMINRVQSRLGLTRLTFQPYTHSQLQEIVLSRIKSLNVFDPDAMQLVARKVAAVSGDARRCLDICRRAVEITEQQDKKAKSRKNRLVAMDEVNLALQDMFSSPKIKMMMNLSLYEMLMMKAVLSEFKRTGVEETAFGDVFEELCNHCRLEGNETPSVTEAASILGRLGACRLLLVETGRLDLQRRISLNVNQDDVIYALRNHAMK